MILRPLPAPSFASQIIPAWNAIAATQERRTHACWLIAQPDHAALAGDLAAQFAAPEFPRLNDDALRAISLHDAGWAEYDGGGKAGGGNGGAPQPLRDSAGRPLSFLDAPVSLFVDAWTVSIQCAEEKCGAIGGLMVSGHFSRLANHRLASVDDPPENAARLRAFVHEQSRHDEARLHGQPRSRNEIDCLVDLLQFCDLLSLYLCCGAPASVQFPQQLGAHPIVLRRNDELCLLEPSPFREEVSLGVPARRDPHSGSEPSSCTLPVLIR